jgi:two-component system response regulator PilR (NtrC family)
MTQPITIFILEDNLDLVNLFAKTLNRPGYTVTTATDLTSARNVLDSARFNIFLCDMRLPDGDGIHLLREYQNQLQDFKTQVVVVSAEDQYREPCEALGIEFFLSKPVSPRMLISLVDRLNPN